MENKELKTEMTALEEEKLDAVTGGHWSDDSISGGHWDEDAPISRRAWEKITSSERYNYKMLTERSDALKAEGDIGASRHYYREAVALQMEMKKKYGD